MAMDKGKLTKQHSMPPSGAQGTGSSGYFPIMTAPDHDIPFPLTDVYYGKVENPITQFHHAKEIKRQDSIATKPPVSS